MISRMKARYSKGVIVPMEALDLEEGAELLIDVSVAPRRSDKERMKRTMSAAGGWKGERESSPPTLDDAFDEIRKSLAHIPKEPGPTDGAKNYKHYLYGHSKEDHMKAKVKAIYSNGALTPTASLDIEDGAEVILHIDEPAPSPAEVRRALKASAGAWKGKHDPDVLIHMLYEARLTGSRVEPSL